MKTLWALPLLLLAGTARASGFTTGDLETAAQAADTRQVELARETDALRLAIAYDPSLGIAARAPGEQDALLAALPTGEGQGDLRVKWFMAGAVAQPSRGATTVLYNPLARGTLTLAWTKGAEGWQVAGAWLTSAGPATWPAIQAPWRKAFVDDYRVSRAAVVEPGLEWMPFEADRWLGGLGVWARDPAKARALETARKLIAVGRTVRAEGGNIDLLSERARAAYAPIGAMARADGGEAVIFGSPAVPTMLIAGDFSSAGSLEKLSLINLANAEGAK